MEKEYSYPLNTDWTTDEVISVIQFFEAIEIAYESNQGIKKEVLNDKYKEFKKVVPSKSEEKTIFKEFKASSGIESYQAVKQLKDDSNYIKI